MRTSTFAALLLLAACSRPAEPQQPAVSAAPAPVADAWNGKYEGDLVRIEITGLAGSHKVSLFTANATCDGEIGLEEGGVPSKVVSDTEMDMIYKDAYHDDICKIVLTKGNGSLTVVEDAGCATYHGVSCGFNGTASKVK